jgi:hypothetical protein
MLGRRGMVRRRPLLRAAAIGGGAYMVGKSSARRADAQAQQDSDQEARLSNLEQSQQSQQSQQAVPPPRPEAPASQPSAGPTLLDQLNDLTGLHERGALTDDEFAAAKAQLLNKPAG